MQRPRKSRIFAAALCAVAILAGCVAPEESSESIEAGPRELHVFSVAEEWDEDTVGVPHDMFAPSTLVVNEGDNVTITFHNTEPPEETDEPHTFTMNGTYAVDMDLAPGESRSATFTADEAGVFTYECLYHGPTMRGQLVVLG